MLDKINKNILYYILSIVIAATTFGTSVIYKDYSENQILSSMNKTLYTIGKDQESRIIEFYDEILYNLNLIAQGYSISGLKCDNINKIIEYINFKNRDLFLDIFIFDNDINIIYGNKYTQESLLYSSNYTKKSLQKNTLIKKALEGQIVFGEISKINKKMYTDVALPIYMDENIIGTIYAKVDLTQFEGILANTKLIGENVESYIVNKDGIFVTESRFIPNAIGRQSVNLKKIKSAIDYSDKISYINYRDDNVYGMYFNIPYNNLTLILEQSSSQVENTEANGNIQNVGSIAALIEGLLLVISKLVYEKHITKDSQKKE